MRILENMQFDSHSSFVKAETRAPFGRWTWLYVYTSSLIAPSISEILCSEQPYTSFIRLLVPGGPRSDTDLGRTLQWTQCHTVSHCVTQSDKVGHNVKLPWQRPKAFFRPSLSGARYKCQVTRSCTMAIRGVASTASMDGDQIQALGSGPPPLFWLTSYVSSPLLDCRYVNKAKLN